MDISIWIFQKEKETTDNAWWNTFHCGRETGRSIATRVSRWSQKNRDRFSGKMHRLITVATLSWLFERPLWMLIRFSVLHSWFNRISTEQKPFCYHLDKGFEFDVGITLHSRNHIFLSLLYLLYLIVVSRGWPCTGVHVNTSNILEGHDMLQNKGTTMEYRPSVWRQNRVINHHNHWANDVVTS